MIRKITLLALLGCMGCVGCVGCAAPTTNPEAEAQRAVLAQVTKSVIEPSLSGFVTDAQALAQATEAYAAAVKTGSVTDERAAARQAFQVAFLRWQTNEVLQVGPAGAAGVVTGGQSARDGIYSWPTVNRCRVDTHLVERAWEMPGFFDTALVTSTGLPVVEALLFFEGTVNACPATAAINTTGSWAALSEAELAGRRADYAAAVAQHVLAQAQRLEAAWVGPEGFSMVLAAAGAPGSPFPSAQDAVNELSSALFYVDHRVRSEKLGNPAGLTTDCPMASCPELAEAVLSGLSREAIVANLEAAKAVLHGGFSEQGVGFDRLLAARGAQSLADELSLALDEAAGAVRALPAPVDLAVGTHLEEVRAAHQKVTVFSELLRTQFITVLNLRVPADGAGDND